MALPSWWNASWPKPNAIYDHGRRRAFVGNEASILAALVPTYTVTYYVDPVSGSDAADGLTTSTPKASIANVNTTAGANVARIYLKPGIYANSRGFNGSTHTVSRYYTRWPGTTGEIVLTGRTTNSWTLVSGSIYKKTGLTGTIPRVYDLLYRGAHNIPSYLTNKGSAADEAAAIALITGAGQSCYVGSVVYARLSDSRVPDDNVVECPSGGTGARVGNANGMKWYFEDVCCIAGNHAFYAPTSGASQDSWLILHGGWSVGGATGSGLNSVTVLGIKTVAVGHVAAYGESDGFNYHVGTGSNIPAALEIRTVAFTNGGSAQSHNGSSMHDGGKALRIGSEYWGNYGVNVIDVDASTQSWNLGVKSYSSISPTTPDAYLKADFACGVSGSMELLWCSNPGSSSDYGISAYTLGTVTSFKGRISKTRYSTGGTLTET